MAICIYNKKTVKDVEVAGKRVLVRVDFNVPFDKEDNITDDTRLRGALPTIEYLRAQGAKVILMSHLGRPKGEANMKYTLKKVVPALSKLLNTEVKFAADCIGDETKDMAFALADGEVLLLENVRFYKEEEKGGEEFAKSLAALGEVYVSDAFGTAHRAHASMVGVAKEMPAVAGFLLEKEIASMGKVLANPPRPFVSILGGAKVSDKMGVIKNLLPQVDKLLIGGAMANTFLFAQGFNMGASMVEEDKVDLVKELMELDVDKKITLPTDLVVAEKFAADADHKNVAIDAVPEGWMALDMGVATIENYAEIVKSAAAVVWNGPMGVFEMEAFAKGTQNVAYACAETEGVTIIGGGDSVAAVELCGVAEKMSHISTGGGSTLEYLEGRDLPGVAILLDAE